MSLFRTMLRDPDGLPVVGDRARMLGVRVPPEEPADVVPTQPPEMLVLPQTGGMSVAADDPMHLPRHHRPARFRGTLAPTRGDVFEIDSAALGDSLTARPDRPPHHLVEPTRPLHLDAFRAALAATRPFWGIAP